MSKLTRNRLTQRPAIIPSPKIGDLVTCAETGKVFEITTDGFTFNYARDAEGRIYSDEGVDLGEKRELLDRSKPFFCYISSNSKHVTGWKGNVLGDVVESHSIRCPRRSWVHGSHMLAVRVRDVHGGVWYGRSSPGVAIKLRPAATRPLSMAA